MAPGLIVAVLVMMVAALTLVPAIMALLGRRLFWPVGVGVADESRWARRSGSAISARPGRSTAVFGVLLIVLALGALAYKPTYDTLQELPKSTKSLQAYNIMATAFPAGVLGPTVAVVTGSQHLTNDTLAPLRSKLSSSSGVAQVLANQISSDGRAAYIPVLLKASPYSTAALDYVSGTLRPLVRHAVPGDQVLLGGATASLDDVRTSLNKSVNLIFPVALAIIGVILGVLLMAIAAPLYLLVGVGLAFLAALGVTSVVFITLGGLSGLDFSTPIVLYLFVLAIGTDYNIAMSHRLREEDEQRRDGPRRRPHHRDPCRPHGGRRRRHPGRHLRLSDADRYRPADRAWLRRSDRHRHHLLRPLDAAGPVSVGPSPLALLVAEPLPHPDQRSLLHPGW